MWLSIIIPLYNCAPYIGRCLDSLLNQGLSSTDFDIIVVDDGSKDQGADVVKKYCGRYNNIRLAQQPNSGVGAARNRGLDLAVGEYVMFVDADDCIVEGALLAIRQQIIMSDTENDLIVYKIADIREHTDLKRLKNNDYSKIFTGSLSEYCNNYGFHPNCCRSLIHREFISDIRFRNYKVGEDLDFMLRIYQRSDAKVMAFDTYVYLYMIRKGSAMFISEKSYVEHVIRDYIEMFDYIVRHNVFKDYDAYKSKDFICTHMQCLVLTKTLSAPFSIAEIKGLFSDCYNCGLLPVYYKSNRVVKLLDILSRHPIMSYLLSVPFRHIYLKRIK